MSLNRSAQIKYTIMRYFLVQQDNKLIYLPDCHFEEGKREVVEVNQIGGSPVFMQGRRQPDIFVFTIPSGVTPLSSCLIVNEEALVRRVIISKIEIRAHTYMALGLVEDTFPAPYLDEAKKGIAQAIQDLEKEK